LRRPKLSTRKFSAKKKKKKEEVEEKEKKKRKKKKKKKKKRGPNRQRTNTQMRAIKVLPRFLVYLTRLYQMMNSVDGLWGKENGHGLFEAVSALAYRAQQSSQKLSIIYRKQRIVRQTYDPLLLITP
jgi:hypothetical protein